MQRVLTHEWGKLSDQEQRIPDPGISPLRGGASDNAKVGVRGGSVSAPEEVSAPDEVTASSVSAPRLPCSSPLFRVLGEGCLVRTRMRVKAEEETQVEAVGSKGKAWVRAVADRSEASGLLLMVGDV